MTATNMCSNFGGFRCGPPLLNSNITLAASVLKGKGLSK